MAHEASCCICFDDAPLGVACAAKHVTCDECFEQYLVNKAADLAQTRLLAAKAETASLAGDESRLAELGGGCFCPLRGLGGCTCSGPIDDRAIAAHVTAGAFEKYVQAKALLPAARKVQQVTGCIPARTVLTDAKMH